MDQLFRITNGDAHSHRYLAGRAPLEVVEPQRQPLLSGEQPENLRDEKPTFKRCCQVAFVEKCRDVLDNRFTQLVVGAPTPVVPARIARRRDKPRTNVVDSDAGLHQRQHHLVNRRFRLVSRQSELHCANPHQQTMEILVDGSELVRQRTAADEGRRRRAECSRRARSQTLSTRALAPRLGCGVRSVRNSVPTTTCHCHRGGVRIPNLQTERVVCFATATALKVHDHRNASDITLDVVYQSKLLYFRA